MVKPFTARELLARVGSHFALARLRRETAESERALRAEAEAAHERAVTILESISDAFLALDRDWRFTYLNAAAERISALTREQIYGRVLWDAFPGLRGTSWKLNTASRWLPALPPARDYYAPSQTLV